MKERMWKGKHQRFILFAVFAMLACIVLLLFADICHLIYVEEFLKLHR